MGLLARLSSVNLSIWVIIGALSGIFCGVFIGDYAANLEPFGSIYVMLLQMCVFPFVVSSLLHGLGSLTPQMALRLLKSGLPVFLIGWAVVFAGLWILSQGIPEARPPVLVQPSEGGGLGELLSLVIPSNPFSDLTQNYVPAIVVFSVIYGIAIQRIKQKDSLLSALYTFRQASVTVWGWVVRIAPLGVFALFADLAGTVQIQLLGGLFLYAVLFVLGALAMALWVLPSLLCAIAPMRYPELMRDLQEALVVAVVTSLPITAVPLIIKVTRKMVEDRKVEDPESGEIISTSLAVSYPIGQLGNLFVAFFVVFAAYYVHSALPPTVWFTLPAVTILSTVGTPVSTVDAVSFMAHWLDLPADVKLLYVELMTLTRYPQVLVSAMSLAFITIIAAFSYYGLARLHKRRLLFSLGSSALLMAALAIGGRAAAPFLTTKEPDPYVSFTLDEDLKGRVKATVHKVTDGEAATAPARSGDAMQRVRENGVLRVGYGQALIPFSYFNGAGDLVGYDVALAYQLADGLGVDLEFYPITDWARLGTALTENRFDLAIGGIYVSDKRLQQVRVSDTYLYTPLALIAHADKAKTYLDLSDVDTKGLRVTVFRDTILEDLAHKLFPDATIDVVDDYTTLSTNPGFDVALWTQLQAEAWAEANPGYSAVVPANLGSPLAIAIPMPPDSSDFARFVDDWLSLQRGNGFEDGLKRYWFDGQPRKSDAPRWSILNNVIGK
ncbi:MAG: ABC transporter substrate-binding protein [Rhizobiaceae bacterium MnEN-MB40S]|nr:MAG: ABC transporter substrate-binding protein [Rhizobiaceae bacterium MnEN-MB40S]